MQHRRRRLSRVLLVAALIAVFGGVLLARSDFVARALRDALVSEVRAATGFEIELARFYVNPIPFYIGFDGIRIIEGDGEEVARAKGMKAYIRWLPLLQKRVVFRRIVVESPDVTLTEDKILKLSELFTSYHGTPGLFRPQLSALYVVDGSFRYSSSSFDLDAERVNLDLFLVNDPEVRFNAGSLRVRAGELNPLSGEVRGEAIYHDGEIKISQLRLESGGSILLTSGVYRPDGTSDLDVDLSLAVDTFRQAMKLDAGLNGKGTVTARGNVVFGQAASDTYLNLSLGGSFPLETLLASITGERDDDYYGVISLKGTLKGRATELEGHADATLTDGSVIGIEMDEARCGVTYSEGRLAFTNGAVRLYGGTARAEVSIGIPDVADHSVDVWFEDAESQKVFALIDLDSVGFAGGAVTGEIHSHGTWFRPEGFARYKSDGQGRDLIGRVRSISGRFTTTDSGVLRLDGFLAQTARTRLAFSGGVAMESGELDLSGEVVSSGVDDLLVPHFDRLGGAASFKGTVRGTADAPRISGTFMGEHVTLDRDYEIGEVVLKASYSMDALLVDSLDASHDSGAHRVSGKVLFPRAQEAFDLSSPEYDLALQANGITLGLLLDVLSLPETVRIDGTAETSVRITGRGAAPVLAGSALVRDGSAYGVDFESAELEYAFDGKRFTVRNGKAHAQDDARLEVDGSVSLDDGFSFNARAWSLELDRLWPEITSRYGVRGELDVTAEGSGTLDEPRIKADVDLVRTSLQGRPVADSRFAARMEGSKSIVSATLMGGRLSAEVSVEHGDGTDLRWRAGVDIFYGRYDVLVVPFLKTESISDDFVLGLEGRIDAEGIGRTVKASASLTRASIMYERQGFTNLSDLSFTLDGTLLEIGSFRMRSAHTNVVAEGSVDIGHAWNLDLSGDSELLPLGRFLKGIETVRGYSSYTLRVAGPWESPEFSGEVAVSRGGFNITGQPQRFTDVSATVRFQGHEALVEKARARVGGGTFEASGVAYLKGFGVERFNFEVEGRNLSVWLDKGFVVKAAANVIYSGTPGEPMLSGDVRLLNAQYTKRIEWQKWLLENLRRRDAVAEVRTDGGGTGLNLRVYGDEGVRIDNNLARADLLIDVFVRGSTKDPRLFGRIEARSGKVFFRNSEFDIQRASADFLDQESLTPYLSVMAETSVKSYQITLNLEGRADRIEMTLASSPNLDEVGILGLLAYGETGQNLQGMEEGIGAAEAAGIIGGGLSGSFEETVTTLTGLDRVQLDPYVSRNSGEIAPRLTVSKRLVGEHLYVTYSYSLGNVPDEELRLEYRLSDQVSVTGGQDSYGSLGGDLKFRLRFQ